jgi:hypothetical protein
MRQIDRPEEGHGELKRVEKPAPPPPEWTPTGTPGIERHRDGRMRNVTPAPPPEQPTFPFFRPASHQ